MEMNSNFNSQPNFFFCLNWVDFFFFIIVFFAYLCSWPPAPSPWALWGRRTHCASLWTWCHWARRCWSLPAPSRGCPPSGRGSRGFSWQRANSRRAPSSPPNHIASKTSSCFFLRNSCKPFELVDEERQQSNKDHGEQHQHGRPAVDGVGIHQWRWKASVVQSEEVMESPGGICLSLGSTMQVANA